MSESIEDFRNSCRFCLQIKYKTILLTPFHILTYQELTGVELDQNNLLPLTICLMCNRELRKFQDFRTRLLSNQQRLADMLIKNENLVEIDSMAELIPSKIIEVPEKINIVKLEEVRRDEEDETKSMDSESTISQDEIQVLDDYDEDGMAKGSDLMIVSVESGFKGHESCEAEKHPGMQRKPGKFLVEKVRENKIKEMRLLKDKKVNGNKSNVEVYTKSGRLIKVLTKN